MKRKGDFGDDDRTTVKKPAPANREDDPKSQFRDGLFAALDVQKSQYAESSPYKHGVISDIINPGLLRNVRAEIQEHISFTPKETDIYRIEQSGDLANLDGLDKDTLKRLPSIQVLRNALYSSEFRDYLSKVTGAGPLSGSKTDMAINVYTPGCHLLCHDDVIGSRRVSYILYLTDPDRPWKAEWGGALRLYPTVSLQTAGKDDSKVPSPDHSVSIPPAFNQLSFFAVQPGESFHDVEEVYAKPSETDGEDDQRRVRMAISGWYHIPQRDEVGYVEGLEDELAKKSSLMQLQGKGDEYDLPRAAFCSYTDQPTTSLPTPSASQEDGELSTEDLDFLIKYMNPHLLTPDVLDTITKRFEDECSILIDDFLSKKFIACVYKYLESEASQAMPETSPAIEAETPWKVARPPHKHRYLYQLASDKHHEKNIEEPPLLDILKNLIPSSAFQKWLQIATGARVKSYNTLARRFRKGKDYTLAQRYELENPGLELCLSLSPNYAQDADQDIAQNKSSSTGIPEEPEVGGYLAYIAGDDAEDDEAASQDGSDHGIEVPLDMSTGGRSTRARKPKLDPAVYQAQDDDDDDDGVLFSMTPSWNQMGIVLRDKGTMRFVKYLSKQAKGDRWDVFAEFEADLIDEESDGDDDSAAAIHNVLADSSDPDDDVKDDDTERSEDDSP